MVLCGPLCVYLSGEILLHVVSGNKDPAFEPSALQLQVLSLSPQQVGLLLRLERDTVYCRIHISFETWQIKAWGTDSLNTPRWEKGSADLRDYTEGEYLLLLSKKSSPESAECFLSVWTATPASLSWELTGSHSVPDTKHYT